MFQLIKGKNFMFKHNYVKHLMFGTVFLLSGLFIFSAQPALAATAGPNYAGSGASVSAGSGTIVWTNPGNITTVGSPYSTVNLPKDAVTEYLQGTAYGFNIPTNATITGITVVINRRAVSTSSIDDSVVRLLKAGALTGNNLASSTSWSNNSFSTQTYGGSSNLWGGTWTPADINASNFGVAISAISSSNQTRQLDVDYIRITITYTITHTVTAAANSGGSISPTGTVVVNDGNDQTFSITPSAGYVVSDVLVDGVSQGRIDEYTFNNVVGDHSITASFDGGWSAPSANTTANNNWDHPERAYVSDNNRTSANSQDDDVLYYDFGLTIPPAAIINGIEVSTEGYTSSTRQTEIFLSWNGGTSYTSGAGIKTTDMTTTESTRIFGGSSDTWGRTWTGSEFSDSNFRVKLDATSAGPGPILYIDQLQIKIHYTSDTTAPTLTEVTPAPSVSNSADVSYTFSSTEAGTITYSGSPSIPGSCYSTIYTTAKAGSNTVVFTGVPDGSWTCTLTVTDASSNVSNALTVGPFTVDTVAPTFTINEGTDVGPVKTDTINVSINESITTGQYGFSADNICDASDTYGTSFTSGTNFTVAGDHTDYLCVKATDLAGNTGYERVGQLNTDNTGPTASLTSPTSGDKLRGAVTITATASDTGSGVARVEFWHSSVVPYVKIGEDTEAPYSISWDTVGVADGSHNVWIVVYDNVGNYTTHAFVPVTVDNTAPSLSFTGDFGNVEIGPVMSDNIAINFGDASIEKYGYVAATGDCVTSMDISGFTDYTGNFTVSDASQNGKYVCAYGEDAVGNKAVLVSANDLNIDVTAPTITVYNPDTNPAQSKTLTAETNQGTLYMKEDSGGACPGDFNYSDYQSITYSSESDNGKTVCYKAVDEAGNETYQMSDPIGGIDTTAPTLKEVTPVTTPGTDSTPSYTFNSTEAGSITYGGGCSSEVGVAVVGDNSVTFNTLSDGIYNCTIQVTDAAGNQSSSLAVTAFTIDTTNPTISITAPLNNAYVKGTVTITADASDTGTGVKRVAFWYGATGDSTCNEGSSIGEDTESPYSTTWNTIELNGEKRICAAAYDQVNNVTLVSILVTVDNTAPTITAPADVVATSTGTLTTVTLGTATATDLIDESPTITNNAPEGGFPVGDTTVIWTATDDAGNTATANQKVTINQATVISNEATASVSTTSITFTWTTDHPATSRVIYDTVSHPVLGLAPNYGYANSTVENASLVTSHSVVISGLNSSTTYFMRSVSHGSPEAVGAEVSASTTAVSGGGSGGSNGGSALIVTPPASGSVGVGSGGTGLVGATNQVTLNLVYGGDIVGIAISNYPDFHDAGFQAPTPTVLWTLLPGDGERIVYVRFRNSSGGTTDKTFVFNISSLVQPRVLGEEKFNFTRNLRFGMRNADVLELQKVLIGEGLLSLNPPTNYFGALTLKAVKDYQTKYGIKPVSGFVGPLTRAQLNK